MFALPSVVGTPSAYVEPRSMAALAIASIETKTTATTATRRITRPPTRIASFFIMEKFPVYVCRRTSATPSSPSTQPMIPFSVKNASAILVVPHLLTVTCS